jgi:hypothetical protein
MAGGQYRLQFIVFFKAVSLHAMEANGEEEVWLLILDLGTRWG